MAVEAMGFPVTIRGLGVAVVALLFAGCQVPQVYQTQTPIEDDSKEPLSISESVEAKKRLSSISDRLICLSAIHAATSSWDNSTRYRDTVAEAKRRGFTIRKCLAISDTPSEISTRNAAIEIREARIEYVCGNALRRETPIWDTATRWQLFVAEAKRRGLTATQCAQKSDRFQNVQIVKPDHRPSPSFVARVAPRKPRVAPPNQSSTGSGFFISKFGHIITNHHVVDNCRRMTVGDNANNQVRATLIANDRRNDLALLKLGSLETASADTKSLVDHGDGYIFTGHHHVAAGHTYQHRFIPLGGVVAGFARNNGRDRFV